MQSGKRKQLMKPNKEHTFSSISIASATLSLIFPRLCSSSWVQSGSVLHHHGKSLRKCRCLQSLEIQIHLLDLAQEEGQLAVSRDEMGEGWLSGREPRGP